MARTSFALSNTDMRARTATFISALALSSLTLGVGPSAALADAQCPNGDAVPGTVADAVIQDATVCMLNEKRAAAGEVALAAQPALQSAAIAYSQTMVSRGFFAHVAPDGSTVTVRIAAVGYTPPYASWILGENIGWGTGRLASPAAMVEAWMNSTEHRENILDGRFREIGVGIAAGVPLAGVSGGVTYTTEFGTRSGLRTATAAGARNRDAAVGSKVGQGDAAVPTSGRDIAAHATGKARKAKRGRKAKSARKTRTTHHSALATKDWIRD